METIIIVLIGIIGLRVFPQILNIINSAYQALRSMIESALILLNTNFFEPFMVLSKKYSDYCQKKERSLLMDVQQFASMIVIDILGGMIFYRTDDYYKTLNTTEEQDRLSFHYEGLPYYPAGTPLIHTISSRIPLLSGLYLAIARPLLIASTLVSQVVRETIDIGLQLRSDVRTGVGFFPQSVIQYEQKEIILKNKLSIDTYGLSASKGEDNFGPTSPSSVLTDPESLSDKDLEDNNPWKNLELIYCSTYHPSSEKGPLYFNKSQQVFIYEETHFNDDKSKLEYRSYNIDDIDFIDNKYNFYARRSINDPVKQYSFDGRTEQLTEIDENTTIYDIFLSITDPTTDRSKIEENQRDSNKVSSSSSTKR